MDETSWIKGQAAPSNGVARYGAGRHDAFGFFLEKTMLVLTRKPLEAIRIGDDIRVIVSAVKGNRVRIAIHAPGLTILREEVLEKETTIEHGTTSHAS